MFQYCVVAVLSVLLYLHGFFPMSPASYHTPIPTSDPGIDPPFNKAVIMVIDAIRLDFISEDLMPFLWSKYRDKGCFSRVKVESPTVTLPRIKALTTGNVPQFIDIIVNLAKPEKLDDSFIHRLQAKGKGVVFYGDDTWLKLFPNRFKRSEGTSSFFVRDFYEVDNNVTRNVKIELQRNDWDVMILHYLGLDHIGHVLGPKSSLIQLKLSEMDGIIEDLYHYSSRENVLIVVTGDHGMRDSGGHGGSTFSERHVPFILLGSSCTNGSFSQTDIAANLAVLLGFDIPATSIGQLQTSLLGDLPLTQHLNALRDNALLLNKKIATCNDDLDKAVEYQNLFLVNDDLEAAQKSKEIFENCSRLMSEELHQSSTKQNIISMVASLVINLCILLKIVPNLSKRDFDVFDISPIITIFVLQVFNFNSMPVSVVLMLVLLIRTLSNIQIKENFVNGRNYVLLLTVLQPFTFLSSSFLEEEHQFWYFFLITIILLEMFKQKNNSGGLFLLMVLIRFARSLNQVGDKWATAPDLSDWFIKPENQFFLETFYVLSLVLTLLSVSCISKTRDLIIDALVLFLIYVLKTRLEDSPALGKLIWFLLLLKLLYSICTKTSGINVWVLIISLLMKPYNVVLIPICIFASLQFQVIFLDVETSIMVHHWMGIALFFAQGQDNSLASVDISSGYIGLTSYEPLLVIPQVLFHTYAFPVLSHLLLLRSEIDWKMCYKRFLAQRLFTVSVVFIVTFIHRHHLFIWSVFAPKIFVESAHIGFLFLEICGQFAFSFINKEIKQIVI